MAVDYKKIHKPGVVVANNTIFVMKAWYFIHYKFALSITVLSKSKPLVIILIIKL